MDNGVTSKVERIIIEPPEIGFKGWLINRKGKFLFEEGPTTLWAFNCTAGGSGGFAIYDGVPNEDGYFPHSHLPAPHPSEDRRNGRMVVEGHPATLGAWSLGIQMYHGLYVVAQGGFEGVPTFGTLSWMPGMMGAKSFLWKERGTIVLEKGPTEFRGIAITHGGTGSLVVYDGVPDSNGHFPDGGMPETDPEYAMSNGRKIFEAHPPVVQMWYPGAGCFHGLTIRSAGGQSDNSPHSTVTWQSFNRIKK